MTIESMKQTEFASSTYNDWKEKAEAALKGKPFDAALITPTIEGIDLAPLYTEDGQQLLADQATVVQTAKGEAGWKVAQEVEAATAQEFLDNMREDLARGNEMIVYTSGTPIIWSDEELEQLAELIQQHPIFFKLAKDDSDILRVFDVLSDEALKNIVGVISTDEGVDAPENVRDEPINTIPVHQAGGTAIQELGVALSMIVEKAGEDGLQEIGKKLWVRFAVDTHFFQEISKLRAFRVLWKALQSAYETDLPGIPVFTETSMRSYSKLDPYVNLLRAGNSTFSAVLGGTDAHTAHPHDLLTGRSPVSMRIARNVQLVIKEETHVKQVLDPSAGSFFIEKLTAQFVEEAWQYFLRIEEQGGYSEVKRSGWLADELQAKWVEREQLAASRKTTLIGTNVYANPQEANKESDIDESHMEFLAAKRLSVPFEQLRAHGKETVVKTAIVLLEPLNVVKPQADFVSGVLSVAGIEPLISERLETAQQVADFLVRESIDYAVLCGKPETFEAIVPELNVEAKLDVAGRLSKEQLAEYRSAGISGTVYSGMNLTKKLEEILSYGKAAFEHGKA
ncbi:methylmalonyl-CoA mutase family protein [Planomicrobium sp. YIM 101495]|uniref:methylmalonyl-CoA mutase family protein n=1 Tax=Planomicrobium sp. YIM 101495 TaxID=2665160 RepID=UPI0012B79EAC|nr:methylmalonyl-CoA mutase family protein [Planomicrobium sp. YIM 101495]MTD29917.1 methylmalonyl-CoA mutase [Planomicrobium sp. YIM 101495]